MEITIGKKQISRRHPTYFVADIAANHDGQLERAVELIRKASVAGADAAKFQHFRAESIVSREGFASMDVKLSHQAEWKKSVFEVYREASIPWEWTTVLKKTCEDVGIEFMSAPYDLQAIDMLDPFLNAYKVGSGDITWIEELEYMARKGKPILLATGASDLGDVQRAVQAVRKWNQKLVLMQCNTNYTGSVDNFRYVQLGVLQTYAAMYPDFVLGLSDHTPGYAVVLGAVALGARVIEKHFTDDCTREGPDHAFSLDPANWREMVERTRELEAALGDGDKHVQANEQQTVIVQRRCLRAARALPKGVVLARCDVEILRPAPIDSIFPYDLDRVVGARTRRTCLKGDYFKWSDLC